MTESNIIVLFLHAHRLSDIDKFLSGIAKHSKLNILFIVSHETKHKIEELSCELHKAEAFNIQELEKPYTPPSKDLSEFRLLIKELTFSYKSFKKRYQIARNKITEFKKNNHNPVLITYDDRISGLISILKASSKLQVPVFLPVLLASTKGITANSQRPMRKLEKYISFFIRPLLPRQFNSQGRLFYSPIAFLILSVFNSLAKNPWARGSLKFTSSLGVESQLAKQELLKAGVNKEKLQITGMPFYDEIDFSTQNQNDKNLLCALPPYHEHGLLSESEADQVILEILEAFSLYKGNVIISLHPRMSMQKYQPLVEKYGFIITQERIEKCLKKATIFFTASTSTTANFSLLMGVPTIMFNHVSSAASDIYKPFKSPIFIENNASKKIVEAFNLPIDSFHEPLLEDQELLSKEIVADGNCSKRNLEIIQSLARNVS